MPTAALELSTPQSPATSGGDFSYALAYHNGTASALSNAKLSLPVPAGASFVSADGGRARSGGVVEWTLSSVAAGASGEVNVNLKAPVTSVAHAPLLVAATLRNSASQILAQASDAKAMNLTPALTYALTTTAGPVMPGQTIQFTLTVTNLSSVAQPIYLYYDVPQFTTSEGDGAGTTFPYNAGNVAAGATQVVGLNFTVLSGTNAPPDGSLITAVVTDRANGALVSCSATVRSVPSAVLELSTSQSPVASGGNFSYTLAYHNGTASALSSAQLSLPLPTGAGFVSANGGGVLGTDGVVRWTLSSVPAGASGDVNVTLKAPATSVAHAPLLVAAAFRNSTGQILAQASDAKVVYVTPALSYSLSTTTNPARPGQVAEFTVSVTNRSSAAKAVYLYYNVPQFTTSEGDPAGTTFAYNVGNVAAGVTKSVTLSFTILSGTQAPPNGSLIHTGDHGPVQRRFGIPYCGRELYPCRASKAQLATRTIGAGSSLTELGFDLGQRQSGRPLESGRGPWPETAQTRADCRRNGTNSNTRASEIWGPEFGTFRQERPIEIFSLLKPSTGGHGCMGHASILRAFGRLLSGKRPMSAIALFVSAGAQ